MPCEKPERGGKYEPDAKRYAVQFTPVGWHVIDTQEARDPVAQFGAGPEEYKLAKEKAEELNDDDS